MSGQCFRVDRLEKLANLKGKIEWTWQWHGFVAFSTPRLQHRSHSIFLLRLSRLNRLKWQKPAAPLQLCSERYFLASILCNICPHFQHFKGMCKRTVLPLLIFCHSPVDINVNNGRNGKYCLFSVRLCHERPPRGVQKGRKSWTVVRSF